MGEEINISKDRYEELLEAERMLDCLEGCGVDNWPGYDDAMKMFNQHEEE